MSQPIQRCRVCGREVVVKPDGRGYPPTIAKRRLVKLCSEAGHKADPVYTAGVSVK